MSILQHELEKCQKVAQKIADSNKVYVCRPGFGGNGIHCSKRPMRADAVPAWLALEYSDYSGSHRHLNAYWTISRDYGKWIRRFLWVINVIPGLPTYHFDLKPKPHN